ncbi:MAG: hypothetical protein WA725_05795, partial [Pseudolabrys sp.]
IKDDVKELLGEYKELALSAFGTKGISTMHADGLVSNDVDRFASVSASPITRWITSLCDGS